MIAAAEAIVHSWVSSIEETCPFEVLDSIARQAALKLRSAHVEKTDSVLGVNLDSFLEVRDRILVIAHILIDETALDVVRQIVRDQFLYLCELLEGFSEGPDASKHEAEMEHGRRKCGAVLHRVLEELNGFINFLVLHLLVLLV